ncbi:MAG TPA: DegT/DnrJ/EryC1/StrS family aminotransferase [Armatimonadota bacterium]|jgi:dTDP-4-amino-4,6-dideoxygalactose transaminase
MYVMGEEEIQAVRRVIESRQLFRYQGENASETDRFEQEWAAKVGAKYALALTSGTASLICALAGLGVGPGDEVIVPGYTFIATALAPLAVGAVPVIAEVDESLTLDPLDVEAKITPRTKAILPVHMNGLPCNMEAIMDIAARHELKVIEDACQADGGSYRGRRLGSIGDAGGFSFNYFKIISCGEGGAMVTDDEEVYERAILHHDGGCVFFREKGPQHLPIFAGGSYRFNEISAAILRVQLSRLDGILADLRADKRRLREGLAGATGFTFNPVNDLDGDCGVTLSLLLESAEQAAGFVTRANEAGVPCGSPINSGRHVYSNWEAIMTQRGSHNEGLNPFRSGECDWVYAPDMCPQTLDVLARTVNVGTNPARTEAEAAAAIEALRQAARG